MQKMCKQPHMGREKDENLQTQSIIMIFLPTSVQKKDTNRVQHKLEANRSDVAIHIGFCEDGPARTATENLRIQVTHCSCYCTARSCTPASGPRQRYAPCC